MADDSQNSTPSGKSSTGKGDQGRLKLNPEQALQILQQSLLECERAGIAVHVAPFYRDTGMSTIIVLANVELDAGKLMPAIPTGGT